MTDLFDFHAPSNRFAVMGNPVAHSCSPRIHRLFAAQFGIAVDYRRIQVDLGGFAPAVSHFAARGGAGLNITVPFKVEAWRLCGGNLSKRAEQAQAVNTVRCDRGQLFGDNTDGIGLLRDLENNLNWVVAGRRVLILGAGGAVRGAAGALAERGPAMLTIANRTAAKARAIAEQFGGGANIIGGGYEQLDGGAFDLVINATSAGLAGETPNINAACLGDAGAAYDMFYANEPTAFMNWATANGAAAVSDGLGMLVEQAAESFYLWHNRRPDTAPVIAELRATST